MKHVVLCGAALAAAFALTLPAAEAADAAHGKEIFETCAACHGADGHGTENGPALAGVLGRRAGSADFRYSPAMQRSGITWDEAKLAAFAADPQATVRGTRMAFQGLGNTKDAEDVVAYIKTLK